MEDYGYGLERVILAATSLGLGTCWLGGTFNRGASASMIGKGDDEVVPAVTPVGYPGERRAIMDRAVRFIARAHSRKAWGELFFLGDTGSALERSAAGVYAPALECVRVGPSASNRQPWRIVKEREKDIFHFFLSPTPGYGKIFPEVSLQDIDLGIAMCHFEAAAQETGLKGGWQRLPEVPAQRGQEYIVSWIEAAERQPGESDRR
jgi:nitroreductase